MIPANTRCAGCTKVINFDAEQYVPVDSVRELYAHTICWDIFIEFVSRRIKKAEADDEEKQLVMRRKLH